MLLSIFSSPKHKVLKVSYCGQSWSIVHHASFRRESSVVRHQQLLKKPTPPTPLGQSTQNLAYSSYTPGPFATLGHGSCLENLFFASSPEQKGHLTRKLVGSIGVTCRPKIPKYTLLVLILHHNIPCGCSFYTKTYLVGTHFTPKHNLLALILHQNIPCRGSFYIKTYLVGSHFALTYTLWVLVCNQIIPCGCSFYAKTYLVWVLILHNNIPCWFSFYTKTYLVGSHFTPKHTLWFSFYTKTYLVGSHFTPKHTLWVLILHQNIPCGFSFYTKTYLVDAHFTPTYTLLVLILHQNIPCGCSFYTKTNLLGIHFTPKHTFWDLI